MTSSVKITFFIGAVFLALGIYLPFFPLWLESNGFNKSEIAFLLSVPLLMKVIFTPFVTTMVAWFPTRRQAALLYSFLSLAIFFSIGFFDEFAILVFLIAVYGIFFAALLPLGDSFILTEVRLHDANFGRIRLWGSVTFIISNLVAGYLIQTREGIDAYLLITAMLLLGFLAAFLLPVYHEPASSRQQKGENLLRSLVTCLKEPVFLAVIVSASLLQASHALLYGFGTIDWVARGYSTYEIGAFWAIGVLSEIILFTQAKFLFNRMSPAVLLVLGGMAAMIRWGLHSEIEGVIEILLLQILHGFTFGATYLGMQSFISAEFDEKGTPAAQGAMVFISGLTMAILTYMSGILFEIYGSSAFYFMALVSLIALLPLIFLLAPKRR